MNKNHFWTTDRLLPKISSDFINVPIPSNKGISISELNANSSNEKFGERIFFKDSKVIQYYQLSEELKPNNAKLLQEITFSVPLPFVPCSLYSPSFDQLSEDQKNYFLYFCQSVREEKTVQTSYQYIQLYLARFLRTKNHFFKISGEIFWVWKNYRKSFPLIDKLFSDFISDLCFYLRIKPPFELLSDIFTSADFYIRPFLCDLFIFDYLFHEEHKISHKEKEYILRTMTSLSFRKSKAYRHHTEFPYLTEEAVEKAFSLGLFNIKALNDTLLGIQIPSGVTTVRKLFAGLCQQEIPLVEIRLQHIPLMHDINIRERCDGLIRYLENRIRSILRIKNCLSRIHISSEHKSFLDGILCEYERYTPITDDAPTDPPEKIKIENSLPLRELHIDIKKANQIENDSRTVTNLLTEDFSDDLTETVILGEEPEIIETKEERFKEIEVEKIMKGESEFWEFAALLSENEDNFVRTAIYLGVNEARKYATRLGAFFEAMLANCNEKAQDATGDSVFNADGKIYEEYLEALKEVFPPIEGEKNE